MVLAYATCYENLPILQDAIATNRIPSATT
jgi:hypothetical protein